jgi:hypothetical protein
MARATLPGGSVVIVDFVRHQHEWMRQELGVAWLGFSQDEVRAWFADGGLERFDLQVYEGSSSGRDLPATFIASGRKPAASA